MGRYSVEQSMPEGWKIWRKGGASVRGRRRIGWVPNEEGLLDGRVIRAAGSGRS